MSLSAKPRLDETSGVSDDEDARHMRRALRLAARAAGRTSPNPLVGSVIVRDGEVVGEGFSTRPLANRTPK